ncbi:multicopper oxidase domain-containing protein [Geminocystis sp. GBBB08]|uniref:multicopper oxidase domain-containing protein n=1 Tax=Geminocystis sp. GBBB08 TaxID=2604140 RepID=UPI0027E279C3|nr:multicopper oxidase domain-containing protein [Geminocystis sp. GBBB08]MBL1209529.1 multicopper oxidase domain-containing protein [Geminocystis sp. GBBB08]
MNFSRRQFLTSTIIGGGLIALGSQCLPSLATTNSVKIPPLREISMGENLFNPLSLLRNFDYGIAKSENGRKIREFTLTAHSSKIQLNTALDFVSWNVDNRVPAPTLRVTEGELIRIIFNNQDGHSHTLHFHGIHPADMDGVTPVKHGESFIYEFEAKPFGVHLYHCHIPPVTRHVSKGLYGMLIIDPIKPRPPADEMLLVMGGYDIDNDGKNDIYAFNGIPNFYRDYPIPIYQHQLIRLYVLNMIEFETAVTFHLHGNMFQVYPTGMTLKPSYATDVITMGVAERHILEFSYDYKGKFMFHPHQDHIAEQGCMGNFEVIAS